MSEEEVKGFLSPEKRTESAEIARLIKESCSWSQRLKKPVIPVTETGGSKFKTNLHNFARISLKIQRTGEVALCRVSLGSSTSTACINK